MRIGVFDSGKGGELIAERLATHFPADDLVVVNDLEHVPYGEKDKATITALTERAILPLIDSCPIIVIACNTATTAAIAELRERHPATLFVGVEPMVKPTAQQSSAGHIVVLATPFTLQSERYLALKASYAQAVIVDEPDTSGWPKYIDEAVHDAINLTALDASIRSGADTIAIACTHYIDLIETLHSRYPSAAILEPTDALARRIDQLRQTIS